MAHRHWTISNQNTDKANSVRPVYDICCGGPDEAVQMNPESCAISSVFYFHAVTKYSISRKNSLHCAGCMAGFHLVTGNSCGGGYWRHPCQHGLGPSFGRIGSIVYLGLLISGNIHLSCHFIDLVDHVRVVFLVQSNL